MRNTQLEVQHQLFKAEGKRLSRLLSVYMYYSLKLEGCGENLKDFFKITHFLMGETPQHSLPTS